MYVQGGLIEEVAAKCSVNFTYQHMPTRFPPLYANILLWLLHVL